MKRFTSIMISLVMVLSLAVCGMVSVSAAESTVATAQMLPMKHGTPILQPKMQTVHT